MLTELRTELPDYLRSYVLFMFAMVDSVSNHLATKH